MTGFTTRAVAAVLACAGLAGTAAATEPPGYKKVVRYETVTAVQKVEVPYRKAVTRHDECGRPYTGYVDGYKCVDVAVARKVPVVTWVKVCDAPAPGTGTW